MQFQLGSSTHTTMLQIRALARALVAMCAAAMVISVSGTVDRYASPNDLGLNVKVRCILITVAVASPAS